MKYTLKYTRADAKAPEKQPVLDSNRMFFCNSLSCKIILCVFDSDNGEFHVQTPDEAGAAARIHEEKLVFPSLDRCRCFQEDCSAAGLPANFVQIGCNCWY